MRSGMRNVNKGFKNRSARECSKQMVKPACTCGLKGRFILIRRRQMMLRVAPTDQMVPWQKLANERLSVANTLARICVALFTVLVVLGVNSFSVISQQSQLCTSLVEAHSTIDKYQASTLPTTPIINGYCN